MKEMNPKGDTCPLPIESALECQLADAVAQEINEIESRAERRRVERAAWSGAFVQGDFGSFPKAIVLKEHMFDKDLHASDELFRSGGAAYQPQGLNAVCEHREERETTDRIPVAHVEVLDGGDLLPTTNSFFNSPPAHVRGYDTRDLFDSCDVVVGEQDHVFVSQTGEDNHEESAFEIGQSERDVAELERPLLDAMSALADVRNVDLMRLVDELRQGPHEDGVVVAEDDIARLKLPNDPFDAEAVQDVVEITGIRTAKEIEFFTVHLDDVGRVDGDKGHTVRSRENRLEPGKAKSIKIGLGVGKAVIKRSGHLSKILARKRSRNVADFATSGLADTDNAIRRKRRLLGIQRRILSYYCDKPIYSSDSNTHQAPPFFVQSRLADPSPRQSQDYARRRNFAVFSPPGRAAVVGRSGGLGWKLLFLEGLAQDSVGISASIGLCVYRDQRCVSTDRRRPLYIRMKRIWAGTVATAIQRKDLKMKMKIIVMGVLATLLVASSASAATSFRHINIYLDDGTYYGFHDISDVTSSSCGVRGVCYTAYVPYANTGAKRIEYTQASLKSNETINDYDWEEYVDYSPWWVDQSNTPAPFSIGGGYTAYQSNYAYQLGEIDVVNCGSQSFLRIWYQKDDGLWYSAAFRANAGVCIV